MGSPAEHFPLALKAKTTEALQKTFASLQMQSGGRLQVVTIYFDGSNHVLWYYPLESHHGSVF